MSRDRRRGERQLAEIGVDLAFVLFVEPHPHLIAIAGPIDDIDRSIVDAGNGLQTNVAILGVVAAPIKAGRAAKPFVLAAAIKLGFVRAQLEHGDFVGF